MMMAFIKEHIETVATMSLGLQAGAFVFGSFVDVPTFNTLAPQENPVESIFSVWWPKGRNLMVPLILSSTTLNLLTYFAKNPEQRSKSHLVIAAASLALLPYTKLVMGKAIESLQEVSVSQRPEVIQKVETFGNLHHVRTALSIGLFSMALQMLKLNQ